MLCMMVGCFIVALTLWRPSCVASMDCNMWYSCVMFISMQICVVKSLAGLFPRCMLRIGHLPPLWVARRSCRSLNMLLCLEILTFALDLHPPKRCVLLRVWLHFLHSIGPVLCVLLQR